MSKITITIDDNEANGILGLMQLGVRNVQPAQMADACRAYAHFEQILKAGVAPDMTEAAEPVGENDAKANVTQLRGN